MNPVGVGLLGCGNVGSAFVRLVQRERGAIRDRLGVDLEILRILVRDLERDRQGIDPTRLTRSALEVIDGECELVVELIGGVHTAGAFVRRALERGLDVVTANRSLIADRGGALCGIAKSHGVGLGFGASVCSASTAEAIPGSLMRGEHALGGGRAAIAAATVLSDVVELAQARVRRGAARSGTA